MSTCTRIDLLLEGIRWLFRKHFLRGWWIYDAFPSRCISTKEKYSCNLLRVHVRRYFLHDGTLGVLLRKQHTWIRIKIIKRLGSWIWFDLWCDILIWKWIRMYCSTWSNGPCGSAIHEVCFRILVSFFAWLHSSHLHLWFCNPVTRMVSFYRGTHATAIALLWFRFNLVPYSLS